MDNNQTLEILKLRKVQIGKYNVDLAYVTSIEIYEGITQPGITGYITIKDYQGLQEFGDVFSGDDVFITVGVDNDEQNELTLKYKVYTNQGSKFLANNTYEILKLGFCSEWIIDAFTRYVSKPYGEVKNEKRISEIVEDLLKECGASIGYIEPTKQKFENFVTPLWTPYHSIKYLLSFATNEKYSGGYLCWTDMKTGKVNVTSLDYILKGNLGTYESFIVNPQNIRYSGRVSDLTIESFYDSIRMVTTGLPNTVNYGFNYDKKTHVKTSKDMNDYPQQRLSKKFPLESKFLNKKYNSINFCPLFPPTAESIAGDDNKLNDLIEGHLSNKYSLIMTDAIKVNIATLGETKRRAGWLAFLEYPSQSNKTLTGEYSTDNKKMKGKYLIRNIKHEFSLYQDYKQYITLVTDGVQEHNNGLIDL